MQFMVKYNHFNPWYMTKSFRIIAKLSIKNKKHDDKRQQIKTK